MPRQRADSGGRITLSKCARTDAGVGFFGDGSLLSASPAKMPSSGPQCDQLSARATKCLALLTLGSGPCPQFWPRSFGTERRLHTSTVPAECELGAVRDRCLMPDESPCLHHGTKPNTARNYNPVLSRPNVHYATALSMWRLTLDMERPPRTLGQLKPAPNPAALIVLPGEG